MECFFVKSAMPVESSYFGFIGLDFCFYDMCRWMVERMFSKDLAGLGAAQMGRPITSWSAPAWRASAGVMVRF